MTHNVIYELPRVLHITRFSVCCASPPFLHVFIYSKHSRNIFLDKGSLQASIDLNDSLNQYEKKYPPSFFGLNLMVFLIHIISHVTHKYADYFPKQKGLRHSKLQLDKKTWQDQDKKSELIEWEITCFERFQSLRSHCKSQTVALESQATEAQPIKMDRAAFSPQPSKQEERSFRGLFLILTCPSSVRYHQCGVLLLHDRSYIRSSPLLHCNIDNT